MVKVYYYDNVDGDPWLPHEGEAAPISALEEVGVFVGSFEKREEVETLAIEKGYKNMDEVAHFLEELIQVTLSPANMGEKYQSVVDGFWEEHLHIDEEIRYILDGHGYEDVKFLEGFNAHRSFGTRMGVGYDALSRKGTFSWFRLDCTTDFILAKINSLVRFDGSKTCRNGGHSIKKKSHIKRFRQS